MIRLLTTFASGASATFGVFLLFAFGIIVAFSPSEPAMQPAHAADPPVKPADKYTEKVTVRPYGGPGRFLNPHPNIAAYVKKVGTEDAFMLRTIDVFKPGSEIEQADGTIWTVTKRSMLADEAGVGVSCVMATKKPKP